ncbi:MAG: DUF4845 domain-containing protein [Xanthomonadaceae bacterium]|jgi:hypothetical protein|nr:DUF4845 domain-containing protein [Xanthomonadaceae bacterium]
MKRRQSGLSMPGFLTVLVVAGVIAFAGVKIFPIYQGYFTIRSVMTDMAKDLRGKDLSADAIKDTFFRRLYVNSNNDMVKPENIKLEPTGRGWRMRVVYESRRNLVGNLDIVGRFDISQDITR